MLVNCFQVLGILVCHLLFTFGSFPLRRSNISTKTSHLSILEGVLQVLILFKTIFLVIGFWSLFTSCNWNLIIRNQCTHFLWLIILSVGHNLITHLQATHIRHTSLIIHIGILTFKLRLLLIKIVSSWSILRSSRDLAHVDRHSHTCHLLLLLDK